MALQKCLVFTENIGPVSYTHLDVYKRQKIDRGEDCEHKNVNKRESASRSERVRKGRPDYRKRKGNSRENERLCIRSERERERENISHAIGVQS